MPREEIGEGVRVGDRCANTGPSVTPQRARSVAVPDFALQRGPKTLLREILSAHDFGEVTERIPNPVLYETQFVGLTPLATHSRRWMTLEEAERGDIPKSFSKEEWGAMHAASKQSA